MKIIVISDTHSRNKEILDYILNMETPDMIFHLGDYAEDGELLSQNLGVPSVIVRGNGDYQTKYLEDELVEVKGKKIFLTHGHNYNVRFTLDNLIYKGRELGADIVLFGHTHIPVNIQEDNVFIMNPGSPSFPRGVSGKKTFGLISISDTIKMEIIEIK